jgi:GNAT superfamily N-acetyltransferase
MHDPAHAEPVTIRPAEVADIPEVQDLEARWAASAETIGQSLTPVDVLSSCAGGCFFVASNDRGIVGFVLGRLKRNDGSHSAVFALGEPYVEIEDLYVAPEYRSAGIGRRLVAATTDWAGRMRVPYLFAYSATRDIDRILRFYRSCGFEDWAVQVYRNVPGIENE